MYKSKKWQGKMNRLYRIIGTSRQAVHQYWQRSGLFTDKLAALSEEIDLYRERHPGCGLEKLYRTLKPRFIGRDRFISIFLELGYGLKQLKNPRKTTCSVASKYSDLIKGMTLNSPVSVWQSDIAYFWTGSKHCYLTFIIDVYTKLILGYQASINMRAESNLACLRMALKWLPNKKKHKLIHHSDRGSQYIDKRYIALLEKNEIKISMCKTPQANAFAERINGTIKNEYLKYWEITDINKLKKCLSKAVYNYNNIRLHNSLPRDISPMEFFKLTNIDNKNQNPIMHIFEYE